MVSGVLRTVFSGVASRGSLGEDKWVGPGDRLEIRKVLEHLDAVASFPPGRYCLEAQRGQASRIAFIAESSPLESSSLDAFEKGSIGGSCWGASYTSVFYDRPDERGVQLFDCLGIWGWECFMKMADELECLGSDGLDVGSPSKVAG